MADKNQGPGKKPDEKKPSSSQPGGDGKARDAKEKVSASGWSEEDREPRWKAFPVRDAQEVLRVELARQAYADVVAHAKENLEAEVCGVLVGEVCEDDEGRYVSVTASIRGTSAKRGASHVTYTQETWNQIHKRMEEKYSDLQIVGWYHSHPGFGVEFSDMDLFIQKNFFAGPQQIALVTDPLGGEEAICCRPEGDEIRHLRRFWVDGRERKCILPASAADETSSSSGGGASSPELAKSLKAVEDRLGQTVEALTELRTSYYRFLYFLGFLAATVVITWIAIWIFDRYTADRNPPDVKAFSRVPVKIDNEWYWVGSSVVASRMSPEESQRHRQDEIRDVVAQLERMKAEAEQGKAPAASGTSPAPRPAPASSAASAAPASPAPKASPAATPSAATTEGKGTP